jgi:antirestriction protein ArdC
VTDRFVKGIEDVLEGRATTLPWRRPWSGPGTGSNGLPRNGASGRAYSGVNVLLLWLSGYQDTRWYTYKQVQDRRDGSHVRRGSKGEMICFYKILKKKDADGVERTFPLLRTFSVFNFAQIEWAPESDEAKEATLAPTAEPAVTRSPEVEVLRAKLVGHLGDKLTHGGDRAGYSPMLDRVCMPHEAAFTSPEHYVATLAHETAHWTGHASRLARDLSGRFGSESYAAEELVAELASAMLCGAHGVASPDLDEAHLGYLAHWAKTLRKDKYAVFAASRLARAAAEFISPVATDAEGDENEVQHEAASA